MMTWSLVFTNHTKWFKILYPYTGCTCPSPRVTVIIPFTTAKGNCFLSFNLFNSLLPFMKESDPGVSSYQIWSTLIGLFIHLISRLPLTSVDINLLIPLLSDSDILVWFIPDQMVPKVGAFSIYDRQINNNSNEFYSWFWAKSYRLLAQLIQCSLCTLTES